ncbi:2-nitropropane dioxygenase [Mycena galericulata]|nr:2-nitropropane dioxygenase [Mycena galericulata]
MIPINTSLTHRLGLRTPIVSAPMAGATTPDLVAAVTAAGGLGCLGAGMLSLARADQNSAMLSGFYSTSELKEKIQNIRTLLNTAPGTPVPIAIGFIGWVLDTTEVSDDPRLLAILDEVPVAVWFAFGVDLGKYIDQVRTYDEKHGRKTFIFVIVNSVDHARQVTLKGVDALVVQGIEAGGHGGSDAPPLFSLLQEVLDDKPGPLILAAGGIFTGAQIAALLTMGADGVVLGTRFLLTPECGWSAAKKDVLSNADIGATVRTLAFDDVNRTNKWPPKHDGRAIANRIMDDFNAGMSLEERLKKFDESAASGDRSRLIVWAGAGTGLTNDIKPVSDVLSELHDEAVVRLREAAGLL